MNKINSEANNNEINEEYDCCYECTAYGDDYFINEDGEYESSCHHCPMNLSIEESN